MRSDESLDSISRRLLLLVHHAQPHGVERLKVGLLWMRLTSGGLLRQERKTHARRKEDINTDTQGTD